MGACFLIQLDFVVDPIYVANHLLSSQSASRFRTGQQNEHIQQLQTDIVRANPAAWSSGGSSHEILVLQPGEGWASLARRAERLQQQSIEHPDFPRILAETQQAAEAAEQEWERNLERSHQIVFDILGQELTGRFPVYITHPALRQGRYLDSLKAIAWTYRLDWPNYNTVYLWHEALHAFLGGDDIPHAVLELVADEELRTKLNGGSYPPFVGHSFLEPLKLRLLKSWRQYLATPERDIFEFLALAKADDPGRSP